MNQAKDNQKIILPGIILFSINLGINKHYIDGTIFFIWPNLANFKLIWLTWIILPLLRHYTDGTIFFILPNLANFKLIWLTGIILPSLVLN